MNTDTYYRDGYTINVKTDDSPSNPFEEFDGEPPTLTYYEGVTKYGDVPSIRDLVALIPDDRFDRFSRVDLFRSFGITPRDAASYKLDWGCDDRDALAGLLAEEYGEPGYRDWGYSEKYFDLLESLANLAGVTCYGGISCGYCQGDAARVLVFATPQWAETVGAPYDSLERQCEGAFDLYGAWAWGDVYGYTIDDPDGCEIDACWGFYGRDHEYSGLLEQARGCIDWYVKAAEKEAEEQAYWESRDIVTTDKLCLA